MGEESSPLRVAALLAVISALSVIARQTCTGLRGSVEQVPSVIARVR